MTFDKIIRDKQQSNPFNYKMHDSHIQKLSKFIVKITKANKSC